MRSRWIRGPNQPAPIEDAEVGLGRFAYDLGFFAMLAISDWIVQFLDFPF